MQNRNSAERPSHRDPAQLSQAFDNFVNAGTCYSTLSSFQHLLDLLGPVPPRPQQLLYAYLKPHLVSWKATSLWTRLDKRAAHRDYKKQEACRNTKVLVIGAGPCGLRTAIEVAFLGGKAVVVEKRGSFSRNNVLHLWPYLIHDLRSLGAKKFYGKFCTGSIDHIGTRQLQLILVKVALLLGVEVHVDVSFEDIIEPKTTNDNESCGWKARFNPPNHAISEFEFDVLIDAGGKRNTIKGFKRTEFRGKLAIAITANFINRNTQRDAQVEEISGVAFIFNQKFFTDLRKATGIDLENIVYYKDDTHYFIMTAKKQSLLDKGVLKQDFADTVQLLSSSNVNHNALLSYAREAADISTNHQLPSLDYAVNHQGQADIAMFDFTSMFAAENASRVIERSGQRLLLSLVGDSLLEPFWPIGSGVARGFLSSFDAAWMIRSWASGKATPLNVIAERESYFQYLSQTTPENLNKKHHQYSLDPSTRYPPNSIKFYKTEQIRHLMDTGQEQYKDVILDVPHKKSKADNIDTYSLLRWCQNLLNTGQYYCVHVSDFTTSWHTGMALCALIHTFRPQLIDYNSLNESDAAKNNQMAFDIAAREFGIAPLMSGKQMAEADAPDKLSMVAYLSGFYDVFKNEQPTWAPVAIETPSPKDEVRSPGRKSSSILSKLSSRLSRGKRRKECRSEEDAMEKSFNRGYKRYCDGKENKQIPTSDNPRTPGAFDDIKNKLMNLQTGGRSNGEVNQFKVNPRDEVTTNINVKAMGARLVSKFRGQDVPEEKPAVPVARLPAALPHSEVCCFCSKRLYLMERMSAAGYFFHRSCFKCAHCSASLTLGSYNHDRSSTQPMFYCYRHNSMMQNHRRKRNFLDADYTEGKIPSIYETPPKQQATELLRSPKRVPEPLSLPRETFSADKKTPERAEFENSLDGVYGSEEQQTLHNLRSSQSFDALLADDDDDDESTDSSDEDSDEDDDEDDDEDYDGSSDDELLPRRLDEEKWLDEDGEDSSDDSGSEEEDTATESDDGSDTEQADSNGDDEHGAYEKLENAPSPVQSPKGLRRARESFFTSPPEVVRIDAWRMFGIKQTTKNNDYDEKQGDADENVEVKDNVEEEKDSREVLDDHFVEALEDGAGENEGVGGSEVEDKSSVGNVFEESRSDVVQVKERRLSNSGVEHRRLSGLKYLKGVVPSKVTGDVYPARELLHSDPDLEMDDETVENTMNNLLISAGNEELGDADPAAGSDESITLAASGDAEHFSEDETSERFVDARENVSDERRDESEPDQDSDLEVEICDSFVIDIKTNKVIDGPDVTYPSHDLLGLNKVNNRDVDVKVDEGFDDFVADGSPVHSKDNNLCDSTVDDTEEKVALTTAMEKLLDDINDDKCENEIGHILEDFERIETSESDSECDDDDDDVVFKNSYDLIPENGDDKVSSSDDLVQDGRQKVTPSLDIDDSNVTRRNKKRWKNKGPSHSFASESSFTISTPSGSLASPVGSLSSLLGSNIQSVMDNGASVHQQEVDRHEPVTRQSDDDMMLDYHVTLSRILGEELPEDVAERVVLKTVVDDDGRVEAKNMTDTVKIDGGYSVSQDDTSMNLQQDYSVKDHISITEKDSQSHAWSKTKDNNAESTGDSAEASDVKHELPREVSDVITDTSIIEDPAYVSPDAVFTLDDSKSPTTPEGFSIPRSYDSETVTTVKKSGDVSKPISDLKLAVEAALESLTPMSVKSQFSSDRHNFPPGVLSDSKLFGKSIGSRSVDLAEKGNNVWNSKTAKFIADLPSPKDVHSPKSSANADRDYTENTKRQVPVSSAKKALFVNSDSDPNLSDVKHRDNDSESRSDETFKRPTQPVVRKLPELRRLDISAAAYRRTQAANKQTSVTTPTNTKEQRPAVPLTPPNQMKPIISPANPLILSNPSSPSIRHKHVPVHKRTITPTKPPIAESQTPSKDSLHSSDQTAVIVNATIPFADESDSEMASPTNEMFYTPRTSACSPPVESPPSKPSIPGRAVRLTNKTDTIDSALGHDVERSNNSDFELRATLKRELRAAKQAEIDQARSEARNRARLKSDEELGLVSAQVTKRPHGLLRGESHESGIPASIHSASVGTTLGGSGVDKTKSHVSRAEMPYDISGGISDGSTCSINEGLDASAGGDRVIAVTNGRTDGQKLVHSVKMRRKKQTDNPDNNVEDSGNDKKEKRKSLLSMWRSSRSTDSSRESTPKESVVRDDVKSGDSIGKKGKKARKSTDRKTKRSTILKSRDKSKKVDAEDGGDIEKTPVDVDDSKAKTVWYDKIRNSVARNRHRAYLEATANTAPTAEEDDFTDSDESLLYADTLKRKNLKDTSAGSSQSISDEKQSRKVQRAARKLQRQREYRRLRIAQEIQRHLEEVDVRQKQLENRGIEIEQLFRDEDKDLSSEVLAEEDTELMQEWFNLIHEKNALLRYESELMVHAKELELEDRQSRLEQELRDMMSGSGDKTEEEKAEEEKRILSELLDAVEQRDNLVAMLEQDRLREKEEDRDLISIMSAKGFFLSPLGYTDKLRAEREAPLVT